MQRLRGVSGPILGHYRLAAVSGGATGLSIGGLIFSARWATAAFLRAAITRFKVSATTVTAFTTPQELAVSATLLSAFTASDTGGTAMVPPAGQNSFLQVVEAAQGSQFTDIRICGAAALTAGTRTGDNQPFLSASGFSTAVSPLIADFDVSSDQRLPIILQGGTPIGHGNATTVPGNAQGIAVTTPVALGAVGVVRYIVEMEWVEFGSDSAEVLG